MSARRELLVTVGAILLMPRAVFAQAKKTPIVIGYLGTASREVDGHALAELKKELAVLGWKEGDNYILEELWAGGQLNRLPTLAEELAARKPAVIVTATAAAAAAASKAAVKTPIVQGSGGSPVAIGLAASLARPGGMVTGLTNLVGELSEKYLELLLAAAPKLRRVGFLFDLKNPAYATHKKNAHRAIERFGVESRLAEVGSAEDLDRALPLLVKEAVQGLVVMPSPGLFNVERRRIVKFALSQRWPLVSSVGFAEDGALIGYSADSAALYRRAAHYVDRILKGAKPADLPIEQPMHFNLAVNMKTAKALGLTLPPDIMVRATQVIE
jgi:putative ABC transport system substrate-binding protein